MTTERVARKLGFKKLFLSVAGLAALVATPIVFGQVNATQSQTESQTQNATLVAPKYEFEVASIKPSKPGADPSTAKMCQPNGNHCTATNIVLMMLIRAAFGIHQDYQYSGVPEWFQSERYDVEAKTGKSTDDEPPSPSPYQNRLDQERMLQALLEDRLKFKFHRETRDLPVYWLVVSNAGKLQEDEGDCGSPSDIPSSRRQPGMPCGRLFQAIVGRALFTGGERVSIKQLIDVISTSSGRVVLDKTNLIGKYDINLGWISEQLPHKDSEGPFLFEALQKQLGLKLESQKGPVEVIVIDHVEKPSEN